MLPAFHQRGLVSQDSVSRVGACESCHRNSGLGVPDERLGCNQQVLSRNLVGWHLKNVDKVPAFSLKNEAGADWGHPTVHLVSSATTTLLQPLILPDLLRVFASFTR